VSSYDRNTFTRDTPCLCLVRSPLYTLAAAACPGSPHLRRRSSDPALDASHLSGHLARAAAGPGRDVPGRRTAFLVLSNLRRRSTAICAFGTEGWHRHVGPSLRNNPHVIMSSISVSVKPISRKSLRETEAARELKSSAWPDVGEASEGQLPQQSPRLSYAKACCKARPKLTRA
jgi:hypothetical protein